METLLSLLSLALAMCSFDKLKKIVRKLNFQETLRSLRDIRVVIAPSMEGDFCANHKTGAWARSFEKKERERKHSLENLQFLTLFNLINLQFFKLFLVYFDDVYSFNLSESFGIIMESDLSWKSFKNQITGTLLFI